jgi:hypothetical protein
MLCPLLLAALALPRTTQVVVVDTVPGPGVDHTQIHDAVVAAPEGSVVLVRPGTHAGFDIPGKSLAVVADFGGPVRASRADAFGFGGKHVLIDGLGLEVSGFGVAGVEGFGDLDLWVEDVAVVGSVSVLQNHGILVTGGRSLQVVGVDVP